MRPTNIFTQAVDSVEVNNSQKQGDILIKETLNEMRDITRSRIEYLKEFFKKKSGDNVFINNQDT